MPSQTVSSNATSRPLANFHPSVWGDNFLLSDLEYDQLIKVEEKLLPKVGALTRQLKTVLFNSTDQCPLKQLKLIDTIQRLGIEYHFQYEIDQALKIIHDHYLDFCQHNSNDLYITALCFRLLRQHGHKVSTDIFEHVKQVNGEFKFSITCDVMGILQLYEATYLGIQGEDVLDQARIFTIEHLHSILPNLRDSIREQVIHALDYSNRRGLPRLEARRYISIYEEQRGSFNETLLLLAKLDFNLLQSSHKRELSDLYKWWKRLDVPKNFWFARDRFVENYFWALGVYFEPQYTVARKYLALTIAFTSIIDDMYDAYGTFEELEIFNEGIQRWSIPSSETLPSHMKILFNAIWEMFDEMEDEMVKQGREYRTNYGKEVIKLLVGAYFEEAKWRQGKYKPGTKEYMSIAVTSCGYTCLTTMSYIGMGDIVTKEAFDWLLSSPAPVVIEASNIICRLVSDVVGHEFERKREHVPSAVEIYMKEHNVSKQAAINKLSNRVEVAWKDINQEFIRPTKFPAPLLERSLNLSRILEVMYKKGDWYTHVGPEMKDYIKQILIDPISI